MECKGNSCAAYLFRFELYQGMKSYMVHIKVRHIDLYWPCCMVPIRYWYGTKVRFVIWVELVWTEWNCIVLPNTAWNWGAYHIVLTCIVLFWLVLWLKGREKRGWKLSWYRAYCTACTMLNQLCPVLRLRTLVHVLK